MEIIKMFSNYNYTKLNNREIRYIVVHDTGNKTDTAINNAKYFSAARNASAHYFVDDNNIVQVVAESNAAWHAGGGSNGIYNHNSIGIEMCRVDNAVTLKTENKTLELIKYLMVKYNIAPNGVVRHYDATKKNCPASFSLNNWHRWNNFKMKLSPPPKVIDVGSRVKIIPNAKSYDGKNISNWVYSTTFIVDEINGDRCLLDKNGIRTAFKKSDLILL